MALIACPSCGHTVSSVASACPRCGHQLEQPRYHQGSAGSLAECRKCGRQVLTKVRLCPYCGTKRPGRRATLIPLLLVGVLALAGYAAFEFGYLSRVGFLLPPVNTLPLMNREQQRPQPRPAEPAPQDQEPAPSQPLEAIELRERAVQPAEEQPADTVPPAPARPAAIRWTTDWTNIRQGRSIQSPVVSVLRPGQRVEVTNLTQGWWELHVGGRFVGYVAGSALVSQPPS